MRYIRRTELDKKVISYLEKRQKRVNEGQPVKQAWKSARETKAIGKVFDTLVSMAGKRSRCFYCEDSRVEHFWPKQSFHDRVFDWFNMLLACSGCNRLKGTQFPRDASGKPLLIDPTFDDPWNHLFFDLTTGQLVARWDVTSESPNPRGVATTNPGILPLNIESITEARRRVGRRLIRLVNSYLSERSDPGRGPDALKILKEAICDNDGYGLIVWFFKRDGQKSEPFRTLKENDPGAWAEIRQAVA